MSFPGAAPLCETEDVLAGATPSLGLVHSPRRRRPRSPALQCGVLPGAPGGLQREEKPAPRPPPAHGPGWRRGCERVKRGEQGFGRGPAGFTSVPHPPLAAEHGRRLLAVRFSPTPVPRVLVSGTCASTMEAETTRPLARPPGSWA